MLIRQSTFYYQARTRLLFAELTACSFIYYFELPTLQMKLSIFNVLWNIDEENLSPTSLTSLRYYFGGTLGLGVQWRM